ncbi:MAG: SDR family NAD(P)-dependent oxidoreductase [Treponema sp.]|jgi:sorbitol-6-phosphate 2-dehydrogenase|nr:SDR family NAD(P)-dependent oxidoreductase [Treponema sp.]
MNYGYIAAAIRGLCINLSGKPQVVVYESAKEEKIPLRALCAEITGGDTEENMAEIIQKAYAAWKPVSSTGGAPVLIPSSAALTVDGKLEALYWIDSDIDSARKRLVGRDDSPRVESSTGTESFINVAQRAGVVKNRVALVTGGAQGIGEEIVRNLAAAGALVFIADLNLEGARKLAEAVNVMENRTAALALRVNVSDEESVEAMCKAVAESVGGLDLCVSNAGVLKAASVLEQGLADFKFVTDINYTGFFIITKFIGRLLRAQWRTAPRWKTDIIQINSKSGLEGSNKNGAYAGGKFGGLGLVTSFAMELVEYNIKVNAICPGNFLDGPLWSDPEKGLFVQYLKTGKVPGAQNIADVRAFYESKVPMKRGCTGKDLVRAIYYIVEQEYETGQAVPVTGGQVMLH